MRFDEQFLERVRDSTSIVELIGSYVHSEETRQGPRRSLPLPHEKTPSFWVSDSKQIFKCFGCGAGGDAFKFLMLMENLGFGDAVARLAERQGIPLPKRSAPATSEDDGQAPALRDHGPGRRFLHGSARKACELQEARSYLEKRSITSETIQTFGIGYAPPGSELLSYLRSRKLDTSQILACGLIAETSAGQYRDKFRHRVMFPIRDLNGKIMAFGGRVLGDGVPKYLNSPETALYHKGNNLYGLDKARDAIRKVDFAILVEGYFDCVVPFQFGFRNTVASLGTSLTENQVRLLGRYTRNVVISFDPDSAGLSAALSIDRSLLAAGISSQRRLAARGVRS